MDIEILETKTNASRNTSLGKQYLVIIALAVWLGPQRPSIPLPAIPVLPLGFLLNK